MNKKKRNVVFILVLCFLGLVLAGAAYSAYKAQKYQKEPVPAAVNINQLIAQQKEEEKKVTPSEKASSPTPTNTPPPPAPKEHNENSGKFPPHLNLQMDFYSQAPFGDWNYPWQEACEEASVLLVANTYLGHHWTREQFRDEILKLVEWENKTFGDYKDTNVQQTNQMLNDYLNLRTVIHENPSFEDVQEVLNRGHLIIMAFAGKLLGNPHFRNGGPVYHVLVVKGYKEDQKVITHDVGTRLGEDYVYRWSTLQNAMHDFTVPIQNGAKRMIEVIPN